MVHTRPIKSNLPFNYDSMYLHALHRPHHETTYKFNFLQLAVSKTCTCTFHIFIKIILVLRQNTIFHKLCNPIYKN